MNIGTIDFSLYDPMNLPDNIRKERELKRWREIMAQMKYVQDDLPGMLKAEARARESDISYEAWFDHKKRMALRWFGYYRKAKTVQEAQKIGTQYNKIASMCGRER